MTEQSQAADTPQPVLDWPFERDASCPLEPPKQLMELQSRERVSQVRLWDDTVAWLFTHYADVKSLLADGRLSSDISREGFPQPSEKVAVRRKRHPTFQRMDPPKHLEHRRMLIRDFTVHSIEKMREYVEDVVDGLLDEMSASTPPVDLQADLASAVPAILTCHIMGLPQEDADFFHDRVNVWTSVSSTFEENEEAAKDVLDYFAELIDAREESEDDDLVSRLIREQVHAGHLTRTELQHMLHLLLIGGFDTTANMISLGTVVLLDHPDQLQKLVDEPELWPKAVEELLRYLTVAHEVKYLLATEDLEVGDQYLAAGDRVIAPIIAGNWDGDKFGCPANMIVDRETAGHLAFGYGPHQCLGQALARLELQVVLPKLFQRFPSLRLTVDDVTSLEFKDSVVYGLESLKVTW